MEEKENKLESERKKKLQRAFYNTDYTQKRVDNENNSTSKEKDEIISRLHEQLDYTGKQIKEIEQMHQQEKKELIRELKKMEMDRVSRSPDTRRGRTRTRSPRRRSPISYEEKLGNLSSSESGSGSETSDSEYGTSVSSRVKANRLRELVKKREQQKNLYKNL